MNQTTSQEKGAHSVFLKVHTDNETMTNSSALIFSSVERQRAHPSLMWHEFLFSGRRIELILLCGFRAMGMTVYWSAT